MRRAGLGVVGFLLCVAGCAGLVKTEGTSGPLAWRATELETVTRSIRGQPVETYEFTLIVRNVSDRTLVFTKIDRTVYQSGGGQPGHGRTEGRWELRPGVERRFPFYSYTYCGEAQGCLDRGGAQPLWRMTFSGVDDQQRPVESRFEIMLPPRAAPKAVMIAPAARPAPTVTLPDGAVLDRPPADQPAAQVVARTASSSLSAEAPAWQVGDEWEFRTDTPTGKGAYVWSVAREEALDGVPTYVIRAQTREIFYRKSDIATVRETVDGRFVLLVNPPRLRYVWPLAVGKSWEQTFREERPEERRTSERTDLVTVEAEETVSVPAGTFSTLKIVYRDKANGQIRYEEWYAPSVKSPVLLRERLREGLRVRELTSYTVK
jgi:hypothetical protein